MDVLNTGLENTPSAGQRPRAEQGPLLIDTPGKGCVFIVEVPLAAAETASPAVS